MCAKYTMFMLTWKYRTTKNYAGRDFNYMDTRYLIFSLRKDPINILVVVLGFYKVNKEKSTRLNLIQKAGRCALGV